MNIMRVLRRQPGSIVYTIPVRNAQVDRKRGIQESLNLSMNNAFDEPSMETNSKILKPFFRRSLYRISFVFAFKHVTLNAH